jgi:hypothetical protein
MSDISQDTAPQETQRPSDKELNFRKQEEMYQRKLEQERAARIAAEEKIAQLAQQNLNRAPVDPDDDDDSDEPYVDKRRLEKRIGKVVKQVSNDTDAKIQQAVQSALAGERRNQWLRANPDFNEVMAHAQAFADRDPELAETILEMPEGFERQKLVYKNIKALGLHKKPEDQPKIQDKINQNLRSPYYQPTGTASPGYGVFNGGKDISPAEGQNAYKKMQELKGRLRI